MEIKAEDQSQQHASLPCKGVQRSLGETARRRGAGERSLFEQSSHPGQRGSPVLSVETTSTLFASIPQCSDHFTSRFSTPSLTPPSVVTHKPLLHTHEIQIKPTQHQKSSHNLGIGCDVAASAHGEASSVAPGMTSRGAIPRTAPGPKLCLNVASINLPHHLQHNHRNIKTQPPIAVVSRGLRRFSGIERAKE